MRAWADVLRDYQQMSGTLEFAWFDSVAPTPGAVLDCVRQALGAVSTVDPSALARLAKRRLTPQQFVGSSYDPQTRELIWKGEISFDDGTSLIDPTYTVYKNAKWRSGASYASDLWAEFGYAFLHTPYGLTAPADQVNGVFVELLDSLLAGGPAIEIDDYGGSNSEEGMIAASPYFEDGAEWNGTFLWTIYDWQHARVCVILGSSTD